MKIPVLIDHVHYLFKWFWRQPEIHDKIKWTLTVWGVCENHVIFFIRLLLSHPNYDPTMDSSFCNSIYKVPPIRYSYFSNDKILHLLLQEDNLIALIIVFHIQMVALVLTPFLKFLFPWLMVWLIPCMETF